MIICHGDHEYAIFDSIEDHDGMYPRNEDNDCEIHAAELVVSLGGHRGHYLGRDFIYEAMELLGTDNATGRGDDRVVVDRYEDEATAELEPGYTVAEYVDEMVQTYESKLFDKGFYVEWNDGVRIVKVGDEIGKRFRLTIYHDDDSSHLNPNDEDTLFRLHSFSNRHIDFTDSDVLLACQYEFPDGHEDEGFACDEMPTAHDREGTDGRISDHDWVGPDGFMLSYFEHGSCKWGLAGSMTGTPDFQWDGVQYAGYLEVIAEGEDKDWWESLTDERKTELAESFVETYTYWANGEAYGYDLTEILPSKKCDLGFVHKFDGESDSCFGFLGFDYIQEEVRWVTYSMGATEGNTEIVDEAFGSTSYGRWFVTPDEAREIDQRKKEMEARREGSSV